MLENFPYKLAEELGDLSIDIHSLEYIYIWGALKANKYNRTNTAKILKISRRNLMNKIDEMRFLGVSVPPNPKTGFRRNLRASKR